MVELDLNEEIKTRLFEENQLVTYKWLSQTYNLHVNEAKRILELFIKDRTEAIFTVWILCGHTNTADGVKVRKFQLVHDEEVEKAKQYLTDVHFQHVYSLQSAKLKDSDAIYLLDSSLNEIESVIQHEHSAICNGAVVKRNKETLEQQHRRQQQQPEQQTVTLTQPKKPLPIASHASTVEASSEATKSKITKDDKQVPVRPGNTVNNQNSTSGSGKNVDKRKEKGVMAFFAKASVKDNKVQNSTEANNEPIPLTTETIKVEKNTNKKHAKRQKPISDNNDNKRKRIRLADISSSEEEDENSGDSTAGSQSVNCCSKNKLLASDSDEDDEVSSDECRVTRSTPPAVESVPSQLPAKSVATAAAGGRRRKKKLVQKTSVDEDGFMVTEKVWESASESDSGTDATPSQQENKEISTVNGTKTIAVAGVSIEKSGLKKSPTTKAKKEKVSKKSASNTKQATLTSFFKKKDP